MNVLWIPIALASALPSPQELKEDMDTHPWRPTPGSVAKPDSAPAATDSKPKPAPPTAPAMIQSPATSPAASAATGPWCLQLGALSTPEAARTEQKRLEKLVGAPVEIVQDGDKHKVRTGTYATREEAEAARAALKAKSVDGFPVHR